MASRLYKNITNTPAFFFRKKDDDCQDGNDAGTKTTVTSSAANK